VGRRIKAIYKIFCKRKEKYASFKSKFILENSKQFLPQNNNIHCMKNVKRMNGRNMEANR
jgi:hypothetical protein